MPSPSESKVYFFNNGLKVPLRNRNRLKGFLSSMARKEKKKIISLNYIFCSDSFLLKINQRYLKHDYLTDIISFNFSNNENEIMGEIYISLDRVKANANKLGLYVTHELLRVIFHGILHFCGYEDKKRTDKKLMREKEDFYLTQYLRSIVSRRTVPF